VRNSNTTNNNDIWRAEVHKIFTVAKTMEQKRTYTLQRETCRPSRHNKQREIKGDRIKLGHKTSQLRMTEILRRRWTILSPVHASNCLMLGGTKRRNFEYSLKLSYFTNAVAVGTI
jgi:hypothetical protein